MKRTTTLLFAAGLAVTVIWFAGCSGDDHGAMHGNDTSSPRIVSVYPNDGATDVPTTASIGITFDVPMDTATVMAGFHFSGGTEMHDWMDTLEHHGGMGMMDMDHMMDWMDSIQQHGQFHWNRDMDSCEFMPDSPMASHTEHMILMYGDVRSHNGRMMDMHLGQRDGYMYNFVTGP